MVHLIVCRALPQGRLKFAEADIIRIRLLPAIPHRRNCYHLLVGIRAIWKPKTLPTRLLITLSRSILARNNAIIVVSYVGCISIFHVLLSHRLVGSGSHVRTGPVWPDVALIFKIDGLRCFFAEAR